MLESVMMIWFTLTAVSLVFVALDIQHTPENPVLKWGFLLLTAYGGPLALVLYWLSCRRRTPEDHEKFVSSRWRQVVGSTMHCVAGDGVGILVGAVIGALFSLAFFAEIALEYVLGFAFGWTIFQALFMRDMAGGSYRRSLESTFIPELLSMNCLMAGMIPVSTIAWRGVADAHDPTHGLFWFRMSIALIVGFICAYPMNWWLVSKHLKHGMMTLKPPVSAAAEPPMEMAEGEMSEAKMSESKPAGSDMGGMKMGPAATGREIAIMSAISFAALAVGILIAYAARG